MEDVAALGSRVSRSCEILAMTKEKKTRTWQGPAVTKLWTGGKRRNNKESKADVK